MATSSPPSMSGLLHIAQQAMTNYGLQSEFGADALAQLASITVPAAAAPSAESGAAIRDLRNLLWASIDNDDSRDLDQLTVAAPAADGATTIYVAIADVDALVKRGSPIDDHARVNTTSVYTAAAIFPMLPEKLSTDLTSLGQDVERFAIVVEMTVAATGSVSSSAIYRAIVRNRAKLAYRSVAAWLDDTAAAPPVLAAVTGMDEQVRVQDRVAQTLRRVRRARGALELQTLEAEPVFNASVLVDLRPDEDNRAKQLIEEFMVAANGVSARFLENKGLTSLRRVLRTPAHWDRIVALAAASGERLPAEPDAGALNRFLSHRRAAEPTRFGDLSLAVVKLLGAGEYVALVPGAATNGHFALAVEAYTHSTAPNRRFPDLITQRLLKAALSSAEAPYTQAELQDLAAHCTLQEHNAAKVERSVSKSAAALLLANRIGTRYPAIVTGASDKGTWVRIQSPAAEGKVVRGSQGLKVGDQVQVELVHTDVAHGFIDFAKV